MQLPDKRKVLDALIARQTEALNAMVKAAEKTREGATHEEAKPENDKDTRALEQSYLARGQAMRVEELVEQIQVLRFLPLPIATPDLPISAGMLVGLASDDGEKVLFVAPYGGGTELHVDGREVLVVTPVSPLGKAVIAKTQGDEVELTVRGQKREYEILAVR